MQQALYNEYNYLLIKGVWGKVNTAMKNKELLLKLLVEKNNGLIKNKFNEISSLTGYHVKSVIRINKTLKEKGIEEVLIHGNIGKTKKSKQQMDEEGFIIEQKNIQKDLNFLQFTKFYNNKLTHKYNLTPHSYSYIYNLLTKSNFESPLKHNKEEDNQIRLDTGSLVALKSFSFKLPGVSHYLAIYIALDVVPNQVIYMHISGRDKKVNYYSMLNNIVNRYGIPKNIYAYGLTIFRAPKGNITQFHRMCNELNINSYLQYNKKLQTLVNGAEKEILSNLPDLLAKEKFRQVNEMNHYIDSEYLPIFNNFRRKVDEKSIFTKPDINYVKENILCEKYKRKIVYQGWYNNVQFNNRLYHIEGLNTRLKRGTCVVVYIYLNREVKIHYDGILYSTSVIRELVSKKGEAMV